jgi:hypothetical protein
VRSRSKVRALVALIDSLGIIQPVGINCPAYSVTTPIVTVAFWADATRQPLASASVSAVANFSWPADVPGWSCFPVSVTVRGRAQDRLAGNVIGPIERLLHVNPRPRLGPPGPGSPRHRRTLFLQNHLSTRPRDGRWSFGLRTPVPAPAELT